MTSKLYQFVCNNPEIKRKRIIIKNEVKNFETPSQHKIQNKTISRIYHKKIDAALNSII